MTVETTIVNALRVAADQYKADALAARPDSRMRPQFAHQEREARQLACWIEEHGLLDAIDSFRLR